MPSTRSRAQGQRVAVADNLPGTVVVRDSRDRSGPALLLNRDEWPPSSPPPGMARSTFSCYRAIRGHAAAAFFL